MRPPLIMLVMLIAMLLLLPACGLHVRHSDPEPSHRSHRSHRSHHGHRHHRYWNAAGPAYGDAAILTQIAIMPSKLPAKFEGEFTASQEAGWRKEWPTLSAQLVADGLTTRTDGVVTGSVVSSQPKTGHYMKLEITRVDVGDTRPNDDGTPRLRASSLDAHGFIYNAATGELVADVKFREGSGGVKLMQFEVFMARVGSSLGDWFKARRAAE